jgi:hypothetical protein
MPNSFAVDVTRIPDEARLHSKQNLTGERIVIEAYAARQVRRPSRHRARHLLSGG